MSVSTRSFQHCRVLLNPPRRAACNHDPTDKMSNATHDSRNSGDNRRRRSRGGSNRNNNNNREGGRDNRGGGEHRSGDSRNDSRGGQNRRQDSNRAEEFRPQAPRPPRTYAPVKKTLWQKILSVFGLYKEPVRPARPERREEPARQNVEQRAPKSNTRNARSAEGAPQEKQAQARPERQPSGERSRNERQPKERPRGGSRDSVESPRVYVGNLSYDVTEQDLQELFKGIGGVRNVEIVYNRSTHRSKGYGFVEMLHMDEAIRAVEVLHDQHFMGRKMTVSGAKSKGNDERDEQEERPEREPRPVVLAPTTPAAVVAQVEGDAEPGLQHIEEVVNHAPGTEIQAVAETDLETKYGFDEPKAKTEEA